MDRPESDPPPPRILPRARVEAGEIAPELVDIPARVKGMFRDIYLAALLVADDRPIVSHKDLNEAARLLRTHTVVVAPIAGDDDQLLVRLVPETSGHPD